MKNESFGLTLRLITDVFNFINSTVVLPED